MAEETDLSQNGHQAVVPGDKPEEVNEERTPLHMDLKPVVKNVACEREEAQENSEKKRTRDGENEDGDGILKKPKVEKFLEEEQFEKSQECEEIEEECPKKKMGPVALGPKVFNTSIEMFDYFFKLLHFWPLDVDINKMKLISFTSRGFSLLCTPNCGVCNGQYEQMVLLELLKKGHPMLDKKIGRRLRSFQVRIHPVWQSKCFYVMRNDEGCDDFSFRKCIDKIIPLPENMKTKILVDKVVEDKIMRGHQRAGGRGGQGGRSGGGRLGRGRCAF